MRKIIKFTLSLLLIVGIITTSSIFFKNEVHFKILNAQGKFNDASDILAKWSLISDTNNLNSLYESKNYKELNTRLSEIETVKCSLQDEKISEYCANTFYLNGLVQYRLGEKLNSGEQRGYFESAIDEFNKVLVMSDINSKQYIWSKENIEFIQNKYNETQKKEQEEKKAKQDQQKNDNKQSNEDELADDNSLNKDGSSSKNEEGDSNMGDQKSKENSKNTNSNNIDKSSDSENSGSENKTNSQDEESRLPKQIQQELEQLQDNLNDEQNSQKGFYRSKSTAEQNALNNQNPFSDPFFQDFFGNDPFFTDPFGNKQLSKQIKDPDIKDW